MPEVQNEKANRKCVANGLSLRDFRGSLKKSHCDRFDYLALCDFFGTTHKIHRKYCAYNLWLKRQFVGFRNLIRQKA